MHALHLTLAELVTNMHHADAFGGRLARDAPLLLDAELGEEERLILGQNQTGLRAFF